MPGWQPLVFCGKTVDTQCHFNDLITLTHNIITDLVIVSTLMAVIIAVVIGFRLITSQGNPSALSFAKNAALNLLKGYIVILVAWLIINTLITTLFNPGFSILGN